MINLLEKSPSSNMAYPSSSVRRGRLWVVLGLIVLIVVYNMPLSHHTIPIKSWPTSNLKQRPTKGDPRIANGTLGFGAIFALGLPDRTDKRDAMELSAALTGLQLTWSDGVRGDLMNPKAIPPVHNNPDPNAPLGLKKDAEVGCWRGHMNILQRIVKEGLGSALILEDDADWDVRIVQQMQQFAVAAQDVLAQKPPSSNPTRPHSDSPYGDDWDLFWVGHNGGWPPAADEPFSIIHNDETAPPAFDSERLTRNIPEDSKPCVGPCLEPNERIVQEGGSPVCTVGYAVSQQGARKMMARLGASSLVDVDAQIDPEMTEMCRGTAHPYGAGGTENIRCLVPSPAYIKPHKARGPTGGDSDIENTAGYQMREVGLSQGLMWSTRLNYGNLIDGLELESQYVKDPRTGEWRYRLPEEYRSYPGNRNDTA
jgi:hypothetical protein